MENSDYCWTKLQDHLVELRVNIVRNWYKVLVCVRMIISLDSLTMLYSRENVQEPTQYYFHHSYDIGDRVMLDANDLHFANKHQRFNPKFIGPFRIIDKITQMSYKLALPGHMHRVQCTLTSFNIPQIDFTCNNYFLSPDWHTQKLQTMSKTNAYISQLTVHVFTSQKTTITKIYVVGSMPTPKFKLWSKTSICIDSIRTTNLVWISSNSSKNLCNYYINYYYYYYK
eukprot:TRINITY_DN4625_c1_g1_i2.p1 TRINITY_DN4625_c1_g1~~TRINITY_DN4625_c1_g1_i2.p1  ORF type:complete len:227 (-),score=-15.62 TRINITY_DN4625_c1_g1_i2:68-748(-)